MGLFDNILSKMGYQKANAVVAPTNLYNQMMADLLANKIGVVENATVSAVYKCVSTIATYFSILPLQIVNEKKPIQHRLLKQLNIMPNAWQNPQQFRSLVGTHLKFYGNSFVLIHRNKYNGYATSFEVLHPYWIVGYNFINGDMFWYYDQSKNPNTQATETIVISHWDILHFKEMSYDGIMGVSPMAAANDASQILGKAGKTISNFYDNNAHSTIVLEGKIDAGMDVAWNGTISESQKAFAEKYSGPLNAGKPIELPWNKTLKTIPVNYVDVQLIETMKFTRDQIYTVFGLADFFKEGNNTNIEQQLLAFKNFTMVPLCETVTTEMEYKLLTLDEQLKGIEIEHNYTKLMDSDIQAKANAARTMIMAGTMTPNEGAAWLGNQKIDSKFGDLHFVQQQNQPIEYYDQWPKSQINNNPPKQ